MRRTLLPLAASLAAPLLCACPMPTTGLAAAQQQAQAFNLDARFGRNELVLEQIAPAERDEFQKRHAAWGTTIHVADLELVGMHAHKDGKDVDIMVQVAWYRPEQQELHSTTLQQTWHSKTDGWELASEKRVSGEIGLLGEPVIFAQPDAPRRPTQFPTIRLGGSEPQAD